MRKPVLHEPTAKLTHDDIKRALPPGDSAKEFLCPICGSGHFQLFASDGFICRKNECNTADVVKAIRKILNGSARPQLNEKAKPKTKPSEQLDWTGFTLSDYCEMKKLSALALNSFFGDGSTLEAKHKGKTVVAFPYMDESGKVLATKLRLSASSHDTYFKPKDPHVPYGLWLYTNRADAEGNWPLDVVICEGESDTQTLSSHGIAAIGISGSNGWRPEFAELPILKNAERIFIIEESDEAGSKFVKSVANDLPHEKTFALRLSEKDPSELHLAVLVGKEFGGATFEEEFNAAVLKASPAKPFAFAEEWQLETISADQIEPKVFEWMWTDRIPLNKFTLFFGLPGQGKSTVSIDVAARLTTGTKFADRENSLPPSDVLMLIAEDELDDTVVPRLIAAKADLKRIHFVMMVKSLTENSTMQERRVALDTDMRAVEKTLAKMPNVRLLVIDPVSSYLGEVNTNKSNEVRPLLEGLKDLARRANVTVIGIAHFNKNADQESIHRISGAGAWGEVPRALWGFVPKPLEDDAQQEDIDNPPSLMLNAKLNNSPARSRQGLTFKTVGAEIPIGGRPALTSRIEWIGAATETLKGVMESSKLKSGPKPVKTEAAMAWLKSYLEKGERASTEIFEDGEKAGHSTKTLYEAKKRLDINATNRGPNGWTWSLPGTQEADDNQY